MVYVEPGPVLGHLVLEIDLDAIAHVHMQGQRARLNVPRGDLHLLAFEHVHLASLVTQHHLPLHVHFHHARRSLVIANRLVDGCNVEGLHRRVRRADGLGRLRNLFPARRRLQCRIRFVQRPEEAPAAFHEVRSATTVVGIVARHLLRSSCGRNSRIVPLTDHHVQRTPGMEFAL